MIMERPRLSGGISTDTRSIRRQRKGGTALPNGDLIDSADQDGYEVLITTDQGMRHQQNLAGRRLAVIVLLSTAWPYAQSRIEEIRAAVAEAQPGEFREVPIPMRGDG